MKETDLKLVVKEQYGLIAKQNLLANEISCCGPSGCCGEPEFSMIGDEYTGVDGHLADADLGSGAGNDCFVARALVGEEGLVIGIDMTEAMIEKARENNRKMGYDNVEFLVGDIEDMPLDENTADVVISNCVLNLVPDKRKAFSEIYRVLKHGAHLSVSDVVVKGELPEKLKQAAEMYAGCVAGAIPLDEYLALMTESGLVNMKVQKEKNIRLPDEMLQNYLSQEEIFDYNQSGNGIFSVTVYAEKEI